jgi:site-specific DNA recombinase
MSASNSTNAQQRAAVYVRMSTTHQEDSPERQRKAVLPYCERKGYKVTGEYEDLGIAGDEFDKRPGFRHMLRDATAGKFDVIVSDEPSRLSRQDVVDFIATVVKPLKEAGVRLDTASDGPVGWDDLAQLLMLTIRQDKSAGEAKSLSRRTLGGMVKKAAAGTLFTSLPPYGLRVVRTIDPESGKVIDRKFVFGPEEEVLTVRFIFEAVADRGWSLRRVCRELRERRVKPPTAGRGANKAGGFWNPTTVRRILQNRKYVGDLDWNNVHTGKYSAWRGGRVEQDGTVNRKCRPNHEADIIVVPDVIPPIIDRDTFARAGAALAEARNRTSPRAEGDRYLFTHMLTCGDCGAFLRGQPICGHKAYICSSYKEYGSGACSRNTVGEAALKRAIIGTLKDEILSPARLDEIEAEIVRRLDEERASGEADRLRARATELAKDIAQGNVNLARLPADRLAGVVAQVREWEGERAGVLARLKELEDGGTEAKAILDEARKQLWRLREALADDDEEAQAAVIREVVSKAEIRFTHERTHGKRGASGVGRTLSKPTAVVMYVRPGLGLSCLLTTCPRPTGCGAGTH